MPLSLTHAVQLAGLGQLVLAAASTAFPRILGWHEELPKLRPLLRRFFWIYAAYILAFNVAFGLLSSLRPAWLLDASPLAAALSGFITLYWGVRLALQFAFDRRDIPEGARYRVAEAALVALFVFLSAVYGLAFWTNLRG
jgi:hypothetical protein